MKNISDRITTDSTEDVDYQNEVRKICEEERGGGMTGYERFKRRCVEKAIEMKKKTKKKKTTETN